MEQILETAVILIVVATAVAWLAKRFLFKEKQGCGGTATCKCAKPALPDHFEKGDPT